MFNHVLCRAVRPRRLQSGIRDRSTVNNLFDCVHAPRPEILSMPLAIPTSALDTPALPLVLFSGGYLALVTAYSEFAAARSGGMLRTRLANAPPKTYRLSKSLIPGKSSEMPDLRVHIWHNSPSASQLSQRDLGYARLMKIHPSCGLHEHHKVISRRSWSYLPAWPACVVWRAMSTKPESKLGRIILFECSPAG